MSNLIDVLEAGQCKMDIPGFNVGDTVRVHVKIFEGDKERIQVFEGVVISRANSKNRATFTVRKISYGVGVERIFPLHSPRIDKIEVVSRGHVRRAKLYYLRNLSGKAARIKKSARQQGPSAAPIGESEAKPAEVASTNETNGTGEQELEQ